MLRRRIALGLTLLVLSASVCSAGIRSPGKYCGVVIFDRWGGCTLYSGVYVMHVSEAIKAQLTDQAGKYIQVDATQVDQPINPGDALIRKLTVLGPAPANNSWESPEGMKIVVTPAFEDGHAPELVIRVENVSEKAVSVRMDALAPTLLAKKVASERYFGPSDGPSHAIVTRQGFWSGGAEPRMNGGGLTSKWTVTQPDTLERNVVLRPQEAFEIRLSFELPAGEYEFLAGYGGGVHAGQCIASNLVAFDVKAVGSASLVKVAGRKTPGQ